MLGDDAGIADARERAGLDVVRPRVPITLVRTRRRKMPPVSRPSAIAGSTACASTSPEYAAMSP